jgi:hypothetical protein
MKFLQPLGLSQKEDAGVVPLGKEQLNAVAVAKQHPDKCLHLG